MLKKKIVSLLLGLSVFSVLAFILVDRFYKPEFTPHKDKLELSEDSLKQKFKEAVFSFGMDESFIKKSKNSGKTITVSVPSDLPIPIILNEINSSLHDWDVEVRSFEKKINGNCTVEIISGEEKILSADFAYKDNAKRKAGLAGFLLEDIQSLNEDELESILYSSESFAALLVPSESSVKISQKLTEAKKEYAVLLNDDISDLEFKLNSRYSEARLKNSVRNIVGSFSRGIFFVVDEQSSLYSSSIYPLIEGEISKRGITLITLGSISRVEAGKGEGLNQFLSRDENEQKLLVTDAEYFIAIRHEISAYRKIGYKFINPSLITSGKIN